jgi:hypothetical protein
MTSIRTDAEVLAEMRAAFAIDRPEHFTNYQHCCECYEHDCELMVRDLDTLAIEDVGSQAWNPITFATPEGFAYYLPALARLALDPMPKGWDWYGYIILFELRRDGPRNDRWLYATPPQRAAVGALLEHLYETRKQEIADYDCEYELLEALEIWLDNPAETQPA